MPKVADWSDEDIKDYLNDLDKDETVELNDFEASFVESNLTRNRFSDKQRAIVQKLIDKYGDD